MRPHAARLSPCRPKGPNLPRLRTQRPRRDTKGGKRRFRRTQRSTERTEGHRGGRCASARLFNRIERGFGLEGCGALPHTPAGRSSPCTPGTSVTCQQARRPGGTGDSGDAGAPRWGDGGDEGVWGGVPPRTPISESANQPISGRSRERQEMQGVCFPFSTVT